MAIIRSKQVLKVIAGRVYIAGVPSGAPAVNTSITALLTTALLTAGDNGRSVPLQALPGPNQEGIPVTPATGNLVEIFEASSNKKVSDTNGNEVYGRITQGAFGWIVNYYVSIAGVETSFTMPVTVTTIDIAVPYYFSFRNLPATFATSLKASYVNDDPVSQGQVWQEAALTVVLANTVPNLPVAPSHLPVTLFVNGNMLSTLDGSIVATVGSTGITWTGAAGYNLATTDKLVARWRTQ